MRNKFTLFWGKIVWILLSEMRNYQLKTLQKDNRKRKGKNSPETRTNKKRNMKNKMKIKTHRCSNKQQWNKTFQLHQFFWLNHCCMYHVFFWFFSVYFLLVTEFFFIPVFHLSVFLFYWKLSNCSWQISLINSYFWYWKQQFKTIAFKPKTHSISLQDEKEQIGGKK